MISQPLAENVAGCEFCWPVLDGNRQRNLDFNRFICLQIEKIKEWLSEWLR